MRLAKAATGSRNYKMGMSKAPTRGKVNPKGYIQREVKNRNQKRAGRGNDGQSDRRSGLAKAALRNSKRYVSNRPKPVSNRPKPRPTATLPKKANRPNDMRIGTPEALAGTPQPSQRPIPNLQIGQNGQLDLPFDEAFGLGLVDQQQAMNSELLDLQLQQQEQAMEYANTKRDLGLQFEDVKRGTLNQNAAGGTAFSSQYAVGASDNARNFNNAVNDLDAWNTQANSGFGQQRMGIQNAFNDYIRQAVLRQTMDLSEGAGDLGYGVDAPNADWWDPAKPKKYPGNAPHNRARPAKQGKKKLPTKPAKRKQTPTTKKSSKGRKVKKR